MSRDVRDQESKTVARLEVLTSTIYVGYANRATAAGTAGSWVIKRITLDASGNPTAIEWTDGPSASWTNRASETYA